MRRPRITWLDWLGITITVLVLAAILLPVLTTMKRAPGRQATCANNQRQLAVMLAMLAVDSPHEHYPARPSTAWTLLLRNYKVGGDPMLDCPSSNHAGTIFAPDYGLNANVFGQPREIEQPDTTILLADLDNLDKTGSYAFTAINPTAVDYFEKVLDDRHNRGVIYCAADGHAGYLLVPEDTTITDAVKKAGLRFDVRAKKLPHL